MCWNLWKMMSCKVASVLIAHTYVYADVRGSILLCECTRWNQSLLHLQETISSLPPLLWCFLLSSGFSLPAAEKQFHRSELRKKQSSLDWAKMPFSAFLYLSIAPALSSDGIRKVGQRRAKEGCSTGMLRAEKRGRWGCRRKMERRRAVQGRYQPMPQTWL